MSASMSAVPSSPRRSPTTTDLKLEKRKQAYAVIKASDVMVGID
jgi:molybdopterin-binding protein